MVKSKRMRWAEHTARKGRRGMHAEYWWEIYVLERKRPLGRPRRNCMDNSEIDLREIGWGGMDWIDPGQDGGQWRAFASAVLNLPVP
jgi:hypothetical protein